jgi:hypothetical protein
MNGGQAWIIAGGTGTGKTTFNKNAAKQVHPSSLLVYDVNNEYSEFGQSAINPEKIDFEGFAKMSIQVRNAFMIFEEATSFINRQGANQFLRKGLVAKRHRGNTLFFVFHSLRFIPLDILDLCNYMVIFKTNDTIDKVDTRFQNEAISSAFARIKNSPMLFDEQSGRKFSPHEIVPLQAYT